MNKYTYREAFCLMEYSCRLCKSREIIWNSRDGLTPYEIKCRQCGDIRSMAHADCRADTCIPNYVPFKGNRIFVGDTEWPVLIAFGEESLEERKKILERITDNDKSEHKGEESRSSISNDLIQEMFSRLP